MHPNFRASSVNFILKCRIASLDNLCFLSTVQKLLDRISRNFVYANLELLEIDLRQNICKLQFKNFEIKNIEVNDIKRSFIICLIKIL